MNVPRLAASAAKLLRRDLVTAKVARGERARGLATIDRAMRIRARRKRWLLASLLAAAAVALLGAGLGYRHLARGGQSHVAIQAAPLRNGAALGDADRARRLVSPAELTVGEHVETPVGGGASLTLSTGTSLILGGETALRVQSQDLVERFALSRGELSAQVAKLTSGQRFIIQTPDAEVEVRGTQFVVSVLERSDACGNTRTRLRVSEGTVEVRAASGVTLVAAGQSWPESCAPEEPQAAGPGQPSPAPSAHAAAPQHTAALPTSSSGRGASAPAAALTHQNDLFAEGVALRRQGDVSAALRVYQELMRQYPASPLAENAAVERLRLLSQGQHARARDEARAYLKRYPRGFALEEAKRLAEHP